MKTNEIIARAMCDSDVLNAEEGGDWAVPMGEYVFMAEAAITALSEAGLVIVPREPTEGMLKAYDELYNGNVPAKVIAGEWQTFLTAWEQEES